LAAEAYSIVSDHFKPEYSSLFLPQNRSPVNQGRMFLLYPYVIEWARDAAQHRKAAQELRAAISFLEGR
jgi:hypothetical protein